jgi:hypothetical protein
MGQNPYFLPFFSLAIDFVAQDLLSGKSLRLIPHFGPSSDVRRKDRKIVNSGVGKTATAVTFASGFAQKGYSVLLVDLDTQGNVAETRVEE